MIQIHSSELVPPDRIYVMPNWSETNRIPKYDATWERQPTTIVGQAVKIVHEGLADELEWLREAGEVFPTWQQREDASQQAFVFETATHRLLFGTPRSYMVVTGI